MNSRALMCADNVTDLVKKMLLAFRLSVYSKELVPSAVAALRVAMLNNWTTDSIRAVATFLASSLPDCKLPD
jgi:hypothetical protein